MQVLPLDSGHALESLQISGQDLSWKHMVSQNVSQLRLVLWLQKRVQSAFWKSSKPLVGWSKHCERTRGRQCFCQVGSHHCCNQSGEIVDRLSQLDNVGKVSGKLRRRKHDAIDDVCNAVAGQIVSTNHLPQALDVWAHLYTS